MTGGLYAPAAPECPRGRELAAAMQVALHLIGGGANVVWALRAGGLFQQGLGDAGRVAARRAVAPVHKHENGILQRAERCPAAHLEGEGQLPAPAHVQQRVLWPASFTLGARRKVRSASPPVRSGRPRPQRERSAAGEEQLHPHRSCIDILGPTRLYSRQEQFPRGACDLALGQALAHPNERSGCIAECLQLFAGAKGDGSRERGVPSHAVERRSEATGFTARPAKGLLNE